MTQILSIALTALKSINEVVLGGPHTENPYLAQAKLAYYTQVQYTRM